MEKPSEEKHQEEPMLENTLDDKYSTRKSILPENTSETQKEMEKTKKELEKLKDFIVKKYAFTQAICVLPPQSIKKFIDEEEVPKETEKFLQLYVVVPEDNLKEIPVIKKEIVAEAEKLKQKIWIQVKTPVDIWEICLDSRFELFAAIALSFPLYDKGILGAMRLAEIHKSLVLQKFERYVVSYVLAGSLVRGDAVPTSDVDIFIVINDTDVKRMPRLELKERLRSIIYQYISEATSLAGVKNPLNVQVYLLTEFWEAVKDAHPVMFTFIRDGIPLYDRGTFMPWKLLLKMGKLKPSPEAIDLFMSMGDKTVQRVKKVLLDVIIGDVYWGVLTPSQAMLMLYGLPPPTPKEIVKQMEDVLVKKEKLLEQKYVNILAKIIKIYKDFEHEKVKELKGVQVDQLLKDTEDYLKRLKDLRVQIEKRSQEKTIEQIYQDVLNLMKTILGNKSQTQLLEDFEKQFVKIGKFSQNHLRILKEIFSVRAEFKKGKMNAHKVEDARKSASILINDLIEYVQRKDLISLEKGKMRLKYHQNGKEHFAELLTVGDQTFLFKELVVKKLGDKVEDSTPQEVSEFMAKNKSLKDTKLPGKVFELLKKELGDFEILM